MMNRRLEKELRRLGGLRRKYLALIERANQRARRVVLQGFMMGLSFDKEKGGDDER
jgi:hypothetical protein